MTNTWHRAYCRWDDHNANGQKVRAALWGWTADRIARFA